MARAVRSAAVFTQLTASPIDSYALASCSSWPTARKCGHDGAGPVKAAVQSKRTNVPRLSGPLTLRMFRSPWSCVKQAVMAGSGGIPALNEV